ncbi:hypothetical protein PInf_014233 [Phytophthora infestans]|nr:hypothetical protein PInf_014233 [Phytophthora infestans]
MGALRFKLQLLYAAAATRRMSTQSVNIEMSVGVIGLGQMGGRMADNIRKHGPKLVVCDPMPANVQRQVDQGAKAAANAREVAEQCDTIITMLPSTATVDEHLLLVSSPIDPIFTKKLSKELHNRGATFVDAPVSGGVAGAQNGTLTLMVGGEPDEFERVKPLLKAMGKNLDHEFFHFSLLVFYHLMRKDLGLASSCATSAEASVPLTNSVLQLFNMMVTQGNGHKDFAYILPFLKGGNSGDNKH